jgi:exodeoxyribonuclease V beta subunit
MILRHEAGAPEARPAGGDPQVLPTPELPRPWKVTSFSRLTGEKQPHGPGNGSAHSPGVETTAVEPATLRFLGVPGGTALGTVVHAWIQDWDLSPVEPAAIARQLAKGGLLAPRPAGEVPWEEVLAEMLNTLRTLRLPGVDGRPLHRVCPEAHASEWNFHLPLRDGFSLADVADCFGEHAAPEDRGYGDQLRQLSAGRMTGFLQGFIDRLVRHSGGWGLIDWKTNRLGPAASDYREEALRHYVRESHYFLQCHLYLVALRRHLATVGEDPGRANQAWLVFLRGIAPDSAHGVLRIAPPEPLLAALDTCFAPARP